MVRTSKYTPKNETRRLSQVARDCGIAYDTLRSRLRRGVPWEEATSVHPNSSNSSTPHRTCRRLVSGGVAKISRESGFCPATVVKHLIDYALTPEEIVYLGTCPVRRYLEGTGYTLSSLAKKKGCTKAHVERMLRVGYTVEDLVSMGRSK